MTSQVIDFLRQNHPNFYNKHQITKAINHHNSNSISGVLTINYKKNILIRRGKPFEYAYNINYTGRVPQKPAKKNNRSYDDNNSLCYFGFRFKDLDDLEPKDINVSGRMAFMERGQGHDQLKPPTSKRPKNCELCNKNDVKLTFCHPDSKNLDHISVLQIAIYICLEYQEYANLGDLYFIDPNKITNYYKIILDGECKYLCKECDRNF